jgi:hypothetical protein
VNAGAARDALRPFIELAEEVEERHRRAHHAEEAFVDLAREALERASPR